MPTIKVEIQVGQNRCHKCPFLRFTKFGTTPFCYYFEEILPYSDDGEYSILRCEKCKQEFN